MTITPGELLETSIAQLRTLVAFLRPLGIGWARVSVQLGESILPVYSTSNTL